MPALVIADQVPLAPYTTLELGGPAQHFARIEDRATLLEALHWAQDRSLPVTVLGGGSNVVIHDRGLSGLVLLIATRGVRFASGEVAVQAGELWDEFVGQCVQKNLAGIECLSGIPGRVGATPIQNVGAYGQEVADTITAVEVLDRTSLRTTWLDASACQFGYRTSRFKREPDRYVVLAVRFALTPGGPANLGYAELSRALASTQTAPSLAAVRDTVRALRRAKSMLLEPDDVNRRSAGSFFLNPVVDTAEVDAVVARAQASGALTDTHDFPRYAQPDGRWKLSAAWLIDHSGTHKGECCGGVGVSSRHALALVHHGGASSSELLSFAAQVRERVRASFGIELAMEPVLLGFDAA